MSDKILWEDIYKDFRVRHPNLCKQVIGWEPRGYLLILLRCKDDVRMEYNYLTKRAIFVKE